MRSWLTGCLLVCAALSQGAIACARQGGDPALRAELLRRLAQDQSIRDTFLTQVRTSGQPHPAVVARMRAVDSTNTVWLKDLIRRDGWPRGTAVGPDGQQAAFLLVQHADRDTAFQAGVLPLLQEAHAAGEIPGEAVALLTDRLAKARGQRQRYGTQTTIQNGRPVVDPIEDSVNVDARRAALGMPPLAAYKRRLDSLYDSRAAP